MVATTMAAILLTATAANADTLYNTLDGTVDATHEQMQLTVPGAPGTTTLQLQINGHEAGDHPGCNIPGSASNPHQLQVVASSSVPAVASVAFANDDDTFNTCSDVLTVSVTPLTAGTTTVSFIAGPNTSTPGDWHVAWSFAEATFDVVVTATSTPGGTACDVDPAAPAWAVAILQANGIKNKTVQQNTIASVAHAMGTGATFAGVVKNAHPAYENAVWSYLSGLGLAVPKGPTQVNRPGWICTAVS